MGEQAKDERFKAIEKSRDREAHFNDYVSELKKKDKEEKDEKRKAAKKGFKELLKETEGIDHHSHWSDFKKLISEDPRLRAGAEGRAQEGEGQEESRQEQVEEQQQGEEEEEEQVEEQIQGQEEEEGQGQEQVEE